MNFLRGLFRFAHPKALGLIALSSLLWALAYPPFPLGPIAFVVLAPMLAALSRLTCRQAFGYGFLGGILYNTVMYWWIYNVVKVGPALIIGMGLVVLILFLSLFNGILGGLFRALLDRPWGLAAFPFLWGGLEVLRTWGQMSFPWSHLGYALGHHAVLIQAADTVGVFGLSAVVAGANVLFFAAWRSRASGRAFLRPLLAGLALPAVLLAYGAFSLSRPDPDQGTMDIAMVQPSIPQTKKWNEHYFQDVMQKTWNTMDGNGDSATGPLQGADLIVLPETAVPDFLRSRDQVQARLAATARRNHADLIVGALDFEPDQKPYRQYLFYNSAFLFPGAPVADTSLEIARTPSRQYSKIRLVPFSERLPFDDIFPLINYVNLGEGDFSAGADYEIWNRNTAGGGSRYAPSICYEVIYPDYVRGARKKGAQVLVNITNDGWFGYSNAPFQHANITRFRAVEAGMPVARNANSGISVFYDSKGRVLGKTSLFEQTVLRHKLPLATRNTVYLAIGDAVEWILTNRLKKRI
jgi:apolipoprotein N-acyltransferase